MVQTIHYVVRTFYWGELCLRFSIFVIVMILHTQTREGLYIIFAINSYRLHRTKMLYIQVQKSPSKSHSLSPPYTLVSEVTSEAPIKVAQPLTSLHLSLRGNFRSPHQSRTASHLPTPIVSEVTVPVVGPNGYEWLHDCANTG